jgi:hypothetical protein
MDSKCREISVACRDEVHIWRVEVKFAPPLSGFEAKEAFVMNGNSPAAPGEGMIKRG